MRRSTAATVWNARATTTENHWPFEALNYCGSRTIDKQRRRPSSLSPSEASDAGSSSTSILRSILLGGRSTSTVEPDFSVVSADQRGAADETDSADSGYDDTPSRRSSSLDSHLLSSHQSVTCDDHVTYTDLTDRPNIDLTNRPGLCGEAAMPMTRCCSAQINAKRRKISANSTTAATLYDRTSVNTSCGRQLPCSALTDDDPFSLHRSSPTRPLPVAVVVSVADRKMVADRVCGWVDKMSSLGGVYQLSVGLSNVDINRLLRHAVWRLLLVYMAESDFRFDVEPATDQPGPGATIDTVFAIRRFIDKCATLDIDTCQYHCMRLMTLFNPEVSRLESPDVVRRVNELAGSLLRSLCMNRCEQVNSSLGTTRCHADLLLTLNTMHDVDQFAFNALFSPSDCCLITATGE